MQHYYYSFANGKKNEIIATVFSSHFNELLLLVTNACSKNSFPFQPHTLYKPNLQVCINYKDCLFVLHIDHSIVWSFCICEKINEGIHCDPQLYICSEQPLVICTLMGGYYKDCIAAKSK